MDRMQKEELVASLNGVIGSANLVIVARPSGLTVAESTDLRRRMRESGARFNVTLTGTPPQAGRCPQAPPRGPRVRGRAGGTIQWG